MLGSLINRIKALNTPADIYVINRENVVWLVDYYKNDWPFDMVVVDELSSFKNGKSKRFKALKSVRPLIKRIIGLTGTPAPNGLIDLWAQLYLLDQGERLGRNISMYRDNYFKPDKRNMETIFSYKPQEGSQDLINDKISDICISLRACDYIELPDKIVDDRNVKLERKIELAYMEFEKEMLLSFNDEKLDVASAAGLTNKLLQFCNGAVYREDGTYMQIHEGKIEMLFELIEELQGKPVLVFYNFKHDLDRITKALSKLKLRVGILKDSKDIEKWNNKEIDILLAHPASAAYGLNLQYGGSHIIWFGLNWSLELYQQANARLYRQGQKEKVFIHRIVTIGMDQLVLEALESKDTTQNNLLKLLKAKIEKIKVV